MEDNTGARESGERKRAFLHAEGPVRVDGVIQIATEFDCSEIINHRIMQKEPSGHQNKQMKR